MGESRTSSLRDAAGDNGSKGRTKGGREYCWNDVVAAGKSENGVAGN